MSNFSVDFRKHFRLQRTKLQDISKIVVHIYMEDLGGMFHLFVNLLKFDKEPFRGGGGGVPLANNYILYLKFKLK